MRTYIIIGITLISAVNIAKASPRTDYLQDRLNQARAVEIQARAKYLAEQSRYNSTKKARTAIARELKDVQKREAREYKQSIEAYRASRLTVGNMHEGDMTAPTSWRIK
jgi:hypothetical protein